jgi:hypothetical protein
MRLYVAIARYYPEVVAVRQHWRAASRPHADITSAFGTRLVLIRCRAAPRDGPSETRGGFWSACAQLRDGAAQRSNQRRAVGKVLLLRIENPREAPLLQRQDCIPFGTHIKPRGIANDVDQPIQGVNTAEEIIVLAIGAREEGREMPKTDAFETAAPAKVRAWWHLAD